MSTDTVSSSRLPLLPHNLQSCLFVYPRQQTRSTPRSNSNPINIEHREEEEEETKDEDEKKEEDEAEVSCSLDSGIGDALDWLNSKDEFDGLFSSSLC